MTRSKQMICAAALALCAAPGAFAQGTSFDGTWVGQGTLTANRGRGTDCGPETITHRLTVQGGVVSFNYSPRDGVRFDGPVQADGSFDLVHGRARFSGRFAATGMAGNFSHPSCERSWRFRRQAAG